MAASVTAGCALRYAEGFARGPLHQALGHCQIFFLHPTRGPRNVAWNVMDRLINALGCAEMAS